MFESIVKFFKRLVKAESHKDNSKNAAKERLHLVLMQDRANMSADFLDMMKQEIIEVIKKYIDVDENAIDVKLTNQTNEDGTNGAPALYANIPIISIKSKAEVEKENQEETSAKQEKEDKNKKEEKTEKQEEKIEPKKEEKKPDEKPQKEKKQEKQMESSEIESKAEKEENQEQEKPSEPKEEKKTKEVK